MAALVCFSVGVKQMWSVTVQGSVWKCIRAYVWLPGLNQPGSNSSGTPVQALNFSTHPPNGYTCPLICLPAGGLPWHWLA